MARFAAIGVVLFAAGVCARQTNQITPVQKVLQMIGDMKAKGEKEKEEEVITFKTFSSWCTNVEKDKTEAIANNEVKMQQLTADIAKFTEDATVISEDIAEIDRKVNKADAKKDKVNKAREVTHARYVKRAKEIAASIDQVAEAEGLVKQMMEGGKGASSAASSLLQKVSMRALPDHARRALQSFLEESEGFTTPSPQEVASMSTGAPEAHSFDSKSGGIADMMQDMGVRFKEKAKKTDEEEAESVHASFMELQSLASAVSKLEDMRGRKVSNMKKKQMAAAEAKGDLAATTSARDSDASYLKDLQIECKSKHEDFELRQKLRGEEIEALGKAMEIIGSEAVAGNADKHLPALVQMKARSLAQLRRDAGAAEVSKASKKDSAKAAAAFLNLQSRRIGSQPLAALALRVTADPFSKVKKMIEGMIAKLMTEATDEAEHKGFCDTELGTNAQTREIKSSSVEDLTSAIEEMNAKSALLSQEVATLSSEVTALDAAMAEATEMRAAEKEKNAATVAEAKVAITAVEKAQAVLKEFYAKAAGATALSQLEGVSDDQPETFDKPFTGVAGGGSGGIMGMLDVILSDFQRLEADTTGGEAAAQQEYDRFSADSSRDKAVKSSEIQHKKDEIVRLGADTTETKNDLASTQEELDAANAYFEKLKPSCVDTNASYEDRVERRKAEIESLHEALNILSGGADEN